MNFSNLFYGFCAFQYFNEAILAGSIYRCYTQYELNTFVRKAMFCLNMRLYQRDRLVLILQFI